MEDARSRGRDREHGDSRLHARPAAVAGEAAPGLSRLHLSEGRDGLLYVPSGYRPGRPAPLVLMLHGAGGNASQGMAPLITFADGAGTLLLATDARESTWDVIRDRYGPDVEFIDRALDEVFSSLCVDPSHVAIEGFSDGASCALSLGIGNGDLFTHIVAFSPGFMVPPGREGSPLIFVSHGVYDVVLSIDRCSRRIVPRLRDAGYDVTYTEFQNGHVVPPGIAEEAVAWFTGQDKSQA